MAGRILFFQRMAGQILFFQRKLLSSAPAHSRLLSPATALHSRLTASLLFSAMADADPPLDPLSTISAQISSICLQTTAPPSVWKLRSDFFDLSAISYHYRRQSPQWLPLSRRMATATRRLPTTLRPFSGGYKTRRIVTLFKKNGPSFLRRLQVKTDCNFV